MACECGCGSCAPRFRMEYVRRAFSNANGVERPGTHGWYILKEHVEPFTIELDRRELLRLYVHNNARKSWFRRALGIRYLVQLVNAAESRYPKAYRRRRVLECSVMWLLPEGVANQIAAWLNTSPKKGLAIRPPIREDVSE